VQRDPGKTVVARSGDGNGPDGRIGTVVDKYTIVRLIGRGGMGAVYEARHAGLARRVAMKFLLPELASNREVLRRFENEAKAAGRLEHPNLIAVTDLGRATDGSPYIVMEFLQGQDCATLLRHCGPLPVPRAANIVLQACRGLAVAHRAGVLHRDLKPENLFVTDAGDGTDLVKVLDFGIAKLRLPDATSATGKGMTFGTAHYMSPEQARDVGGVDPRTDVWSLGVVLYELLSGRRPFAGDQFLTIVYNILSTDPPALATLRAGLPPGLLAVVERAMAKVAADRLPSVAALAAALAPFARGQAAARSTAAATTAASHTESGGSAPSAGRSRPVLKLALAVLILAGLGGAALLAVHPQLAVWLRLATEPSAPSPRTEVTPAPAPAAPAVASLAPSLEPDAAVLVPAVQPSPPPAAEGVARPSDDQNRLVPPNGKRHPAPSRMPISAAPSERIEIETANPYPP